MYKTPSTSAKLIQEKWYLLDATGVRLGRLASVAAEILLDKANPLMRDNLTPRIKLVVINSKKLDVTAKRSISKLYTRYSGYPGGLTTETMGEMMENKSEKVVENAIKKMLPKNRRGEAIYDNLNVYSGNEHKHEANQPELVDIKSIKF